MFSKPKPKLRLVNYDPNRHSPKNVAEKLNDLFFILFVLAKGEEKNIIISRGILIKTLFTTQIDLAKDIKFLHTGFYPFNHGPFNKIFYSYISDLESGGLVQKDGYNLSLTSKGADLIQPLFEEIKEENPNYNLIENRIEENLERCKNFFEKSDELHKEKMIDETNENHVVIEMQKVIDNLSEYKNKFIESVESDGKRFVLSNNIINKLLKIEADVDDSDYQETVVLKNSNQLLEMLK